MKHTVLVEHFDQFAGNSFVPWGSVNQTGSMHVAVVTLDPDHEGPLFDNTLALSRRLVAEADPDLDPDTEAGFRSKLHGDIPFERLALVALGADVPVGLARMWIDHIEGATQRAEVRIDVDPGHRRQGVGTALLRSVIDACAEKGRTSLTGMGENTESNDGFWTSFGAKLSMVERESRLWMGDTDATMMQQWVDSRTERAAGYELLYWSGPTPAEMLEPMATLITAMNDAPTDDLHSYVDSWTTQDVVELDAYFSATGAEHHVCVVLDPDGSPAGLTEMITRPYQPRFAGQGNTVVVDAHRKRGIGRWLKADMWLRLRQYAPQVEAIDTDNAASNDAMLAINVAMGFAPRADQGLWQGDVATMGNHLQQRE